MKWLLGFLILPSLSWAACEGLKEAIETCTPFSCEIVIPKMGKVSGHTIVGREGGVCIIETEAGNPQKGKDLGEICRVPESALAAMAESTADTLEMTNMLTDMMKPENPKKSNDEMMKELSASQEKMALFQEKIKISSEKYLKAVGGKSPCIPKDPASMAEFMKLTANMAEAVKPLASMSQSIKVANFKKLFPDGKPACVVSTELNVLNSAQKLKDIKTKEECKKLETLTCSAILKKTSLKKLDCPVELNILYVEADKASGDDVKAVPADLVKSMVCEINGLMRSQKKVTFDPELKFNSKKYCKEPKGYICTARILASDGTVELESISKTLKTRDGAEVQCLKLAKQLASPHCEKPDQKLFAEVKVRVDGRIDLNGMLMNESYNNFCYTHRLKKVFR